MSDDVTRGGPGMRRLLVAGAAVVLVLLVWLVVSVLSDDGDDGDPGGTAATSSPFPSTSVGADGSPLPTKAPGQSEPTEVVKTPGAVAPVRVDLDEEADLGRGVTARVVRVESVQGKGRGPGEVSGPSLRVTIEVTNGSDEPLRTVASGVTAFYGPAARPAIDLSAPGVFALPMEIAPGKSARGRYVFRIPVESRDQVRLDFSYSTSVPKVVFVGGV